MLAYSVSLQTQEFGIRIALGSSKKALMALALREASYPVLAGLAVGTITALATTRVIRSLLYEFGLPDQGQSSNWGLASCASCSACCGNQAPAIGSSSPHSGSKTAWPAAVVGHPGCV